MWFKDFQLSEKCLRRLLSSPDVEGSLHLIKDTMETLDLNLRGFEDWSSLTLPQSYLHDAHASDTSSWDEILEPPVLADWTNGLNRDLTQFAITVKESRKLRTMRIQASTERYPQLLYLSRRDYLYLSMMRAFLSVENLTILELDLFGTLLMPQQEHYDFHICPSIAALLSTLRRLRLRMRSICPEVLKLQHQDTRIRLNEVLVNLSLSELSSMAASVALSTRCGSAGGEFLKLKGDIEGQAGALAAHMVSPKTIRILTPAFPELETRSLDVLTGKFMILDDDAAWEDDGETVKDDSSSEPESEISSVSDIPTPPND
jgi:hypothetical protein